MLERPLFWSEILTKFGADLPLVKLWDRIVSFKNIIKSMFFSQLPRLNKVLGHLIFKMRVLDRLNALIICKPL